MDDSAQILVIDDDATDRKIVRRALKEGGIDCPVDEARDGAEGVRLARQRPYACVLLDYRLPDSLGLEVLRELRQIDGMSVIVLTGHESEEIALQMMEIGAVDYLSKTALGPSLARAVRYALARRRYELERASLQAELERAQRLELFGRLAAGVAHEINTPTQFVQSNVEFAQRAFGGLLRMARIVDGALAREHPPERVVRDLRGAWDDTDMEFTVAELPTALEEALQGLKDIAAIVSSMRGLAHPSADRFERVSLSGVLERAAAVSRGEWGHVAKLTIEPDPEADSIQGVARDLQQLFVNLIVNAAQAIEDSTEQGGRMGEISIETRRIGGRVEVRVSDSGPGVARELGERIFDPFVTSKPVGAGTGQGLAIGHATALRHGGSLGFCNRDPGPGATFIVRLPLDSELV